MEPHRCAAKYRRGCRFAGRWRDGFEPSCRAARGSPTVESAVSLANVNPHGRLSGECLPHVFFWRTSGGLSNTRQTGPPISIPRRPSARNLSSTPLQHRKEEDPCRSMRPSVPASVLTLCLAQYQRSDCYFNQPTTSTPTVRTYRAPRDLQFDLLVGWSRNPLIGRSYSCSALQRSAAIFFGRRQLRSSEDGCSSDFPAHSGCAPFRHAGGTPCYGTQEPQGARSWTVDGRSVTIWWDRHMALPRRMAIEA
ncbi:hypothetical protein QBC34DRAFT_105704 [Podospora aff. communis PSN243]|uniref:Uncharacterized protein n=1 Tax=Podospora aff. communis PSN243 TaxID=3040156 RepID=A0AAV9H325_9PEZI|nr:hypothetical protein QBC34DRAFT_105704 [Podospora aff. communis PSN243]